MSVIVDTSLINKWNQRVEYEIAVSYLSRVGVFFPKTLLPEKDMKQPSHITRVDVWRIYFTPRCFS